MANAKRRKLVAEDLERGYGATTIPTDSGSTRAATKFGIHSLTGMVNVKDLGAIGDGVTDDASAIEDAFETGAQVYLPAGTYAIKSQISSSALKNLTGAGADLSILSIDWASVGNKSAIVLSNDDITVNGISIIGNDSYAQTSSRFAIEYTGSGRIRVANCLVTGHNNFLYVNGDGSTFPQALIENNVIEGLADGASEVGSDNIGIWIDDGKYCSVRGNTISKFAIGVLFGMSSDHCTVSDNRIHTCGQNGIYFSSGNDNNIANNTLEGGFTDLKVRGDRNCIVGNQVFGGTIEATNAVVDHADGFGITSLKIANNVVQAKSGNNGIRAVNRTSFECDATNISITGNIVRSADDDDRMLVGITVLFNNTYNTHIDNNVVEITTTGILLSGVTANFGVHVCGNTVLDCSVGGIGFLATRGIVANNYVEGADGDTSSDGLIHFTATGVLVANNRLHDGAIYGINEKPSTSDNNYFIGNHITSCVNNDISITGSSSLQADNIGSDTTVSPLRGSAVHDPISLPDDSLTAFSITVTGAAAGMFPIVSSPVSLQGITMTCSINSTNSVTVVLYNGTGSTIDLGSGTWKAIVIK